MWPLCNRSCQRFPSFALGFTARHQFACVRAAPSQRDWAGATCEHHHRHVRHSKALCRRRGGGRYVCQALRDTLYVSLTDACHVSMCAASKFWKFIRISFGTPPCLMWGPRACECVVILTRGALEGHRSLPIFCMHGMAFKLMVSFFLEMSHVLDAVRMNAIILYDF